MKVKYQIFVSSTYQDLVEERELVIRSILEMGHIPVGMEMFSAGDEEQWKLIKKQIEDCDYYVVIVAHRYGSMDGKIGYTEKEYDYATSIGLPALGFVIQDGASWPVSKSDTESEKKQKLDRFKSKIKKKIISYWNAKEDLYGKVSIALMKQFTTNPRVGWIKANEAVGPEVLVELSRLSKENSELRSKLDELTETLNKENNEKYDNIIRILQKHKISISFWFNDSQDWEEIKQFPTYDLFKLIAPEMMVDVWVEDLAFHIGYMLNPKSDTREVRKYYPIPSNVLKQLLADFAVLDLVRPSDKRRSLKDTKEYWTLTSDGKELVKAIRKNILNVQGPEDDDIPF